MVYNHVEILVFRVRLLPTEILNSRISIDADNDVAIYKFSLVSALNGPLGFSVGGITLQNSIDYVILNFQTVKSQKRTGRTI